VLENEREGERGPEAPSHERLVEKLLVAEARRGTCLRIRVYCPQQQKPRRSDAGRLPEVGDCALEPRLFETPRAEPEDGEDAPRRAGGDDHDERNPVRGHDLDADRGDGGDDEEVQRSAGNTLHLPVVDHEVLAHHALNENLEQDTADHAQREERESVKDLPSGQLEEPENPRADRNGDADDGEVPGERVDRVAHHGLEPCCGTFQTSVDAEALVSAPALKRHDLADDSPAMRPVDKRHAYDDAYYHARGRYCEAERRAVLPAGVRKALGHAADSAVSALEADLQEVAEARRDSAQPRKDEAGEPEPDDVLPPRDDLSEHELGESEGNDAPDVGNYLAEEERRENNVDQKSRHAPHRAEKLGVHTIAERQKDDKTDCTADDRTWQIQTLQQRHPETHELPYNEKPAQGREHSYRRRHFVTSQD